MDIGPSNIGARADFVIAKVAIATVEGRFSHDVDAGGGKLLNLGLEFVSEWFGVALRATLPSATYRDVASRLGDLLRRSANVRNAYYRVGADIQAQLGFVRSESRADARLMRAKERIDTATASLQLPITKRIRFYGSSDYRSFNGKACLAFREVCRSRSALLAMRRFMLATPAIPAPPERATPVTTLPMATSAITSGLS